MEFLPLFINLNQRDVLVIEGCGGAAGTIEFMRATVAKDADAAPEFVADLVALRAVKDGTLPTRQQRN